MEFGSKEIDPSKEGVPLYPFKLSLSLIHHFRGFQQENHNFQPSFLSATSSLIADFKQRNSNFLQITNHLKQFEPNSITVDLIIIAIHYYFGSIANMETFLAIMKVSFGFPHLSKSHVNRTNIMSPLTIHDALAGEKNAKSSPSSSSEIRYLEEYTFCLMKDPEPTQNLISKSEKELSIDLELLTLTLKAKGKIDPYIVSYICSRLNIKHNLKLHSILFATFKNQDCKPIYTEVYGDVAVFSSLQQKRFSFGKDRYLKFRQILVSSVNKDQKALESLVNLITEIESDLCTSLMDLNQNHLHYIEKLLIGMLGHPEESIRDAAITYLNVLYDEVDWQLRGCFKPKIQCVGDEFRVEYLIESDPEDNNTICFQLNGPPLNKTSNEPVVTWHKPKIIEFSTSSEKKEYNKYIVVSLDLGTFTKCGFFDWKLVKLQKNGKVKGLYKVYDLNELRSNASFSNLTFDSRSYKCKPIHGRFIVHPGDTRRLQIHEVFIDIEGAKHKLLESKTSRGSFFKVRDQIKNYKEMGINCLYLMGALERDNGLEYNQSTGQKCFLRPDASSLAITCRKTPCKMLGGSEGFTSLCEEASRNSVKLIIDCLTKVSSSRPHKRYKKCLLYTLDDEGKSIVCFGTDGRSINYEDTALLNYRKKKVWDLLLEEVVEISSKYAINGIHLENAQAWPQILSLDIKEMYRKDPDNTPAYTEKEIFEGEVVLQDENCGYWASNSKSQYANPFFMKLCKGLWKRFPSYLIVAEAWGGKGFENREFNIVKSGPIPRMFDLPIAMSTLFGKKLRRDGNIGTCEKTNVNVFRTWYENIKKYMPKGSILIQSTTSHVWPYPVLLYKRATWPIIDLFFMLPDIPMTFIGENDGEAFRTKTTNIFTRISIKKGVDLEGHPGVEDSQKLGLKSSKKSDKKTQKDESEDEELRDVYPEKTINFVDMKKMRMSVSHKQMHMNPVQLSMAAPLQYRILNKEKQNNDEQKPKKFKKTKSEKKIEFDRGMSFLKEEDEVVIVGSENLDAKPEQNQKTLENSAPLSHHPLHKNEINSASIIYSKLERRQSGNLMYRVSSGVSISDLGIQQIKEAEELLQKEIGPEYGFDLKQIGSHYQHRRSLRHKHKVLQNGNFLPIYAEHEDGWHTHVMAFARTKNDEIAIIAINFNDHLVKIHLNLKNLRFLFNQYEDTDMIVKLNDLLSPEPDKCDYFTVSELLEDKHFACLNSYSSLIWGATVYQDPDENLKQLAFEKSVKRLKYKVQLYQTIHYNDIANMLIKAIKTTNHLQDFLNYFGYFYDSILEPHQIDFKQLLGLMRFITEDTVVSCKLWAFFKAIQNSLPSSPQMQKLSFVPTITNCMKHHSLGPIAFVSSELGRWTSTGGQGVMINELSEGLVTLGEEVCVVTPYYHLNRKNSSDYLKEENIFNHTLDFDVKAGTEKYTINLYEGKVNGVQIFFMHNADLFPSASTQGDGTFTLRQISVFAKACLEVFCIKKLIPSLVVTNDWFTGLVPGYVRSKAFGDVFDGTKFFHLIHNLDIMYDARIHLTAEEGTLKHIHELPDDWLVDPLWQEKIINPSRCALMNSDQWGTVSTSYKEDIQKTSPLSALLRKFKQPFGFPNGIPKDLRLKNVMDVCNNDHSDAKRKIQKKYFNFKDLDDSICVMTFIGRITQQKGVHLILESLDQLLAKYSGKIQVIVGGQANMRENYGAYCAELMWNLRNKYPQNFWAAPNEYFDDVTLVTVGSDFGLMPSLFEPGGIVQHEFFVGSTPVIAFKTGGLKDTVVDFDSKTKKGNGFTFLDHKCPDFISAIDRALQTFKKTDLYNTLRKNAFESIIDVADVARAWNKEFHRLFRKVFIDNEVLTSQYNSLNIEWKEEDYKPTKPLKKQKGRMTNANDEQFKNYQRVMAVHAKSKLSKHIFKFSTSVLPRPKNVSLIGSFDDWQTKYPLNYDYFTHIWTFTLYLKPGEYFYKYIVDGKWVCSDDEPKNNDSYGNINNYLVI